MKRVLITGAEGLIGSALRRHLSDRYDLRALTREPASFPSHTGDIADYDAIRPAFEGVDSVVHLAGSAGVDAPWDDVLHNNLIATRNVFEAARDAGVEAVVYASSNHAVGGYEAEWAPGIYALDDPRTIDANVPVRPDSLYGVSKVFGEALGRYYSDAFGMRVICLRIGSVRADDDPCSEAVAESSQWLDLTREQRYERLRTIWLSQRDCAQLVAHALDAEDVRFAIVYGMSDNPRKFWSLDEARTLLGYDPEDRAPEQCG